MHILIKTLQSTSFKLEVNPEMSVKELKEQIEKDQGKEYPVEYQKLIYSGKILSDTSKLSEYNIDEKKFVVLMVARPPPAPKPENTTTDKTSSNSKKEESNAPQTSKPKVSTEKKDKEKDKEKESKTSATSNTSNTPSRPTTRSSAAAGSNPSSAQPTSNEPPATQTSTGQNPRQPPTSQTTTQSQSTGRPSAALLDPSLLGDNQTAARLASIITHPRFAHIQYSIQQNPHLLSSTIESLASTDPEMYNFISDNPDLFVNALNTLTPLASLSSERTGGNRQHRADSEQQATDHYSISHMLPSATDQDRQAIERLMELGFSEFLAVQAYVACDRDEQLAANLLFQMDQ